MDHAIDAAKIDKGAEIANVADDTFADIADSELRKKFLFSLGLLALQDGAATEDQIAALQIGFDDDAGPGLPDEFFEVFDTVNRNLAGGNKAADFIDFAFQAAVVVAGDAGVDGDSFGNISPIADLDARADGSDFVESFVGVKFCDDDFQRVADLRFFSKDMQREHTLVMSGKIDEHVVAENASDLNSMT